MIALVGYFNQPKRDVGENSVWRQWLCKPMLPAFLSRGSDRVLRKGIWPKKGGGGEKLRRLSFRWIQTIESGMVRRESASPPPRAMITVAEIKPKEPPSRVWARGGRRILLPARMNPNNSYHYYIDKAGRWANPIAIGVAEFEDLRRTLVGLAAVLSPAHVRL